MKKSTGPIQASHVNSGTSVPADELPWPETRGRVVRFRKTHVEVEEDASVTAFGGLDLASAFCRRFKVAEKIDAHVSVLKRHLPYHESDHVLTQCLNLYVGGTCLEDQAHLQHSEPVLKLLGAVRLPDPTTAGDFLRRFDETENPGSLAGLRRAGDEVQRAVWERLAQVKKKAGKKELLAVVDIDSHSKKLYGAQKEGADFSHSGKWSYRPLVFTLAGVGECLAIRLRPGNTKDPVGVAEVIRELVPRLKEFYVHVLFRGDSAFEDSEVRKACEETNSYYAFVGRAFKDRPGLAASIPEEEWEGFRTRAQRAQAARSRKKGYKSRRKKANRRRKRARARKYKDLSLKHQALAERPLVIGKKPIEKGRLVIRRQTIEVRKGQKRLFPEIRHRYIATNLPPRIWPASKVVDTTYIRCDQENIVEQMKNGLSIWRMPVAKEHGNAAWIEIGRLAWNLGKWIAQLALPEEVVRWEWKRFRLAFVSIPARIIETGRRLIVRFFDSVRFTSTLVAAHQKLQV